VHGNHIIIINDIMSLYCVPIYIYIYMLYDSKSNNLLVVVELRTHNLVRTCMHLCIIFVCVRLILYFICRLYYKQRTILVLYIYVLSTTMKFFNVHERRRTLSLKNVFYSALGTYNNMTYYHIITL